MTDDVKTMHHMILVWNAFATPPVIPPQMLRNLGDYLANFLKSNDGEQYLRTLGYVRAGAPGKPVGRRAARHSTHPRTSVDRRGPVG